MSKLRELLELEGPAVFGMVKQESTNVPLVCFENTDPELVPLRRFATTKRSKEICRYQKEYGVICSKAAVAQLESFVRRKISVVKQKL